MFKRPVTTLFLLESLDGKINSGSNDSLDVDQDWKSIKGVKEGLSQYYELEKQTELHSFNSGRVMAKIGVNERKERPKKMKVSFVILDRKPHLTEAGVKYLSDWVDTLYLVTDNRNHPAYTVLKERANIKILYYQEIKLSEVLEELREKYGIERMTIQSGGTLNSIFLRENLIDYIEIVIAPILVGGKDTATLIDGESISSREELSKLKALSLVECTVLNASYIRLKYTVKKELIKK